MNVKLIKTVYTRNKNVSLFREINMMFREINMTRIPSDFLYAFY